MLFRHTVETHQLEYLNVRHPDPFLHLSHHSIGSPVDGLSALWIRHDLSRRTRHRRQRSESQRRIPTLRLRAPLMLSPLPLF